MLDIPTYDLDEDGVTQCKGGSGKFVQRRDYDRLLKELAKVSSQRVNNRIKSQTSNPWFMSDPHIGHTNIIEYDGDSRPFDNILEHDKAILDNINEKVKTELYILGDVFHGINKADYAEKWLNSIKCKRVHLVTGNHDQLIMKYKRLQDRFESIRSYLELDVKGQMVMCFHYPITSWNRIARGSWHLYGHTHGDSIVDKAQFKKAGYKKYNVGVNLNKMGPVSFEQLSKIMEGKTSGIHHGFKQRH